MTAPTEATTRDLFRQAVAAVRGAAAPAPECRPATHFEQLPRRAVVRGEGPVEGVAGDVWATVDALRAGRTSVPAIVEQALDRIARHDRRLGAFEFVADLTAEAQRQHREALRGALRGPLHGAPLSVKDVIDVEGMPTTGSSAALIPRPAASDATAVARLRAAGALIIGKTVTHEFALGVTTPQSHNPWDEDRVPGGSSGGSAISVVTGMALGSLGTDTRASIRVPAALSGVVGYKPSLGLVPVDRWLVLSWTMDHFAPMARSVRDIALLMDVLTASGDRFRALLPGSLTGLRFGVAEATLAGAQPEVLDCFHRALAAIEAAGGLIVHGPAPTAEEFALAGAAGMVVSRAEAAHYHRASGTDLAACTPEVREQLEEAAGLSADDYLAALRLRGELRSRLLSSFQRVDIQLMPTSKVLAPRREEAGQFLMVLSENCIPWSFVDFPAISLFAGMAQGLPVGVQLVAPPGQDDLLLAAAYAFERAALPLPVWTGSWGL